MDNLNQNQQPSEHLYDLQHQYEHLTTLKQQWSGCIHKLTPLTSIAGKMLFDEKEGKLHKLKEDFQAQQLKELNTMNSVFERHPQLRESLAYSALERTLQYSLEYETEDLVVLMIALDFSNKRRVFKNSLVEVKFVVGTFGELYDYNFQDAALDEHAILTYIASQLSMMQVSELLRLEGVKVD